MKNSFYEELPGIYRLRVPFENLYTSVFLLVGEKGAYLVDCATTREDVEEYILPALGELGYTSDSLCGLVITHGHGDHAGGLPHILGHAPRLEVIRDERELLPGVYTYPLPGHTVDCIGVLDTRTGTLISGDGLQGAGVDKYRCFTEDRAAYVDTLERIKADARIENVLFSHAYEPWNSDRAEGRGAVLSCLEACFNGLPHIG